MNAKADVLPFRQSAIPEQEQIGMAAGVTEELFDGQHMEILSSLTKSLQELTRIRRKEKALFMVALIQPTGIQMALSGVAGAQKVIEAIWASNNMFARHHIAVKVGKLSVNCILDTLGPSQLTMVANRLNDSVKWAVKELELQGECWK